jgi:hypothetical protein
MRSILILVFAAMLLADGKADVIVYGCTSAAMTAAVQAKKMGKSVLVVCPEKHLGGLTAGGLGWTDSGNKTVIGGLAREFYHRVWLEYEKASSWRWQLRSEYGNKGQGTEANDGRTMWIFEPHIAEGVYEAWMKELGIRVDRNQWLDRRPGGVAKDQSGRITRIKEWTITWAARQSQLIARSGLVCRPVFCTTTITLGR